eukprot:2671013-Alexandrium_andersonii.AAC.1
MMQLAHNNNNFGRGCEIETKATMVEPTCLGTPSAHNGQTFSPDAARESVAVNVALQGRL